MNDLKETAQISTQPTLTNAELLSRLEMLEQRLQKLEQAAEATRAKRHPSMKTLERLQKQALAEELASKPQEVIEPCRIVNGCRIGCSAFYDESWWKESIPQLPQDPWSVK